MKIDIGNITTRIAFTCAKFHNSIAILGESGAEKLPGKGAMLFKSNENPQPTYLQGAYISRDELEKLVTFVKSQPHDLNRKFVIPEMDISQFSAIVDNTGELLHSNKKELAEIIRWMLGRKSVSKMQIMQEFKMGNRADAILDSLYSMNLITDRNAKQPRTVLPNSIGEVSDDVISFLQANDISEEDITEILESKT
ncbi:MAG: hypothetical protein FWE14_00435 [Lachnospiraceae bacterium]|nr:hypothetical protein [Lachnospiraceae bacterium]